MSQNWKRLWPPTMALELTTEQQESITNKVNGLWIYRCRKSLELTMGELAEHLEVSEDMLTCIECGEKPITEEMMHTILHLLDIPTIREMGRTGCLFVD